MDHPSASSPKAIPALELDLGAHLTAFLKKLPLDALGRLTHLVERIPKKITPLHLVTAGLLLISQPHISLTVWALLLGLLSRQTVSKQGVFERLDQAAVDFFKAVLGCALGQRMQPLATKARSGRGPFGRILVQDSSTARLNEKLAAAFPGGSNQHGETSGVLRIQAMFDLLTQSWVAFGLSSYRRNDQKASPDILPHLRKKDLVLRDLGYFAVVVLEQIAQLGAFFITRFYFRTSVFDEQGQPLDLLGLLRKEGRLDRWVRIGKKDALLVRIVAMPVPQKVADERRRKARAHLGNRCQLSKEYLAMQGWTIYLTNVPASVLSSKQIGALYGQRWQIEIIFKAWKSHFQLETISSAMSPAQLEVLIYSKLLFITITYPLSPLALASEATTQAEGGYSRLQISLLISQCLVTIVFQHLAIDLAKEFAVQLQYHGRYGKCRRKNMLQELLTLA
jgi:DDE family transposase